MNALEAAKLTSLWVDQNTQTVKKRGGTMAGRRGGTCACMRFDAHTLNTSRPDAS